MITLTQAIARKEGFGIPGARPTRNNNPGDLLFNSYSERHGATHGDPHFAVFPTIEMGWEALDSLLLHNYQGLTVAEVIGKYAPWTENNTAQYVADVCSWTGLAPTAIPYPATHLVA